MDLVRAGQITLGAGLPLGWEGYAAVDALNRILQGEEPVPTGMGLQLFDADTNVPASGGYVPPFDYKAIYKQAWELVRSAHVWTDATGRASRGSWQWLCAITEV
jgi:ribose transport system substrate-binding protein